MTLIEEVLMGRGLFREQIRVSRRGGQGVGSVGDCERDRLRGGGRYKESEFELDDSFREGRALACSGGAKGNGLESKLKKLRSAS
jgi:hypothetical protein